MKITWTGAILGIASIAALGIAGQGDYEEELRKEAERVEMYQNLHNRAQRPTTRDIYEYGRERFPGLAIKVCDE